MHLYEQLQNYTTAFPEEQSSQKMFLQFLSQPGHHTSRSNQSGHITASALLLNQDCSHFLLMHHRKLNQWFQPGGHLEDGENPLDGAIREAQEESGIVDIHAICPNIYDLDVHRIPENITEPMHYHYDIRFLLKTNRDDFQMNDESHGLCWLPLQGYEDSSIKIQASIARMVEKTRFMDIAQKIGRILLMPKF